MTKLYIIREIKRTTQANGGTPLPKLKFESETGIKRYDWFGVYWARWSDALREAGSMPQHAHAATSQPHSKPLPYDRSRIAPSVRLV